VKRVFRYLKGTRNVKLELGGDQLYLAGYSDADWASNTHRHSISGFAFFIGCGVVSWSTKKQPIVTLSSTESEYVALTHAGKEAIWLNKLLFELRPILPNGESGIEAMDLYCDNQGAIRLSKDSTFHARTKHIDVHFHWIRQTVSQGQISLSYVPTDLMIADTFTKSLSRSKFVRFASMLGLTFV
jgi:hypothetical protein